MRQNYVSRTNKRRHKRRLNASDDNLDLCPGKARKTAISCHDGRKPISVPPYHQHAYQVLDEYGCLKSVNHSWTQLTRYGHDESIGRWFGEILVSSDRSRFMKYLLSAGKTRTHGRVVVRVVREDGTIFFVSCFVTVRYDEYGICPQYYCEMEDITDSVLSNAEIELEGDRLELSCVLGTPG